MADYLLDLNILIHWYNPKASGHDVVNARVEAIRTPDSQTGYIPRIYISVVTLAELEYGHRTNPASSPEGDAAFDEFVRRQCPSPWDITHYTVDPYAKIRTCLFERYAPNKKKAKAVRPEQYVDPVTGRELGIQENDLWIAAQAVEHNFVFVTADQKGHLLPALRAAVSDLKVEDWTKPSGT